MYGTPNRSWNFVSSFWIDAQMEGSKTNRLRLLRQNEKQVSKWASENIYFLIFSHFDFLQFCPTVLRQCKTIVKFHFTLSVFRVFCCFMRARTELFTVYYYYYYHCYLLLLILLLLLLLRGFSLCVLFIYFAWQQMHYKAWLSATRHILGIIS